MFEEQIAEAFAPLPRRVSSASNIGQLELPAADGEEESSFFVCRGSMSHLADYVRETLYCDDMEDEPSDQLPSDSSEAPSPVVTRTSRSFTLPRMPTEVDRLLRKRCRKSVSANAVYATQECERLTADVPQHQNWRHQIVAEQAFQIPTVVGQHPDLQTIGVDTMKRLLDGEYSNHFSVICVIDCRYPYEYEGGHIEGAINLYTEEQIEERFAIPSLDDRVNSDTCLVFHCEFSSKRGPQGFRHLRKLDRQANLMHYPKLYYPFVYLLEGGYKSFYDKFKDKHCAPNNYISMLDHRFYQEMQLYIAETRRRSWKKQRSHSFCAFSSQTGKHV